MKLLRTLLGIAPTHIGPTEDEVLRFVRERYVPTIEELEKAIQFFYNAPEFTPSIVPNVMVSKQGYVRVETDICGYEVHICRGPMLDCVPAYYRLTDEEAGKLMDAILSCVPGSVAYAKRFVPPKDL